MTERRPKPEGGEVSAGDEPGDRTASGGLEASGSSGTTGRTPQQRERRYLWGVAALALVLVAAGAGAGALVGSAERPGAAALSSGDVWVLVAILVAVVVLVAAATAWLLQWRRLRGSRMFARSPLWELPTHRERRALVRALRRGRPIAPEQHDLAVRTARDSARRGGLVWLYVAIALLQVGNFFLHDGGIRWFYLVAGAGFLVGAVAFGWQVRRMRRAVARLELSA